MPSLRAGPPWDTPQPAIADIPAKMWDVIIIGAGPAGSVAALILAAAGCSVLLLDRHKFPRDKTCGDLIIKDAMDCLQRLGVYAELLPFGHQPAQTTLYSPGRVAFTVPQNYLTIKRIILDALLARRAVAAGVCLARGSAAGITVQPDGAATVSFHEDAPPQTGRYLLIATGADVTLAAALGMITRPKASGIAVRRYIASPAGPDNLILSFDRCLLPGYAWIFPMGRNEYNIGCGIDYSQSPPAGSNLQHMFDRFLREFPVARELAARGEFTSPLRGARLCCGLTGTAFRGPGNVLAIGECAATTFPFTGEGIGKAMHTGEIAAHTVAAAIAAANPALLDGYERRINAELRPKYRGYQMAQDWLARPWLNDYTARRIRRSRHLQDKFVQVLNETCDPHEIFSWQGILSSYFR